MASSNDTSGIGHRLREVRRRRGFKSPRELAETIQGGNVTTAVIENIEAGRKVDISVSQLLNLAHALQVPPVQLLADVSNPRASIDLPNISEHLSAMDAGEFDAWFGGISGADHRAAHAAERLTLSEMDAYRTLRRLQREVTRQRAAQSALEDGRDGHVPDQRVEALEAEIVELAGYLATCGWVLGVPDQNRG
ncbi:hypothetical protein GCM10027568_29670 [Humibacter soli]